MKCAGPKVEAIVPAVRTLTSPSTRSQQMPELPDSVSLLHNSSPSPCYWAPPCHHLGHIITIESCSIMCIVQLCSRSNLANLIYILIFYSKYIYVILDSKQNLNWCRYVRVQLKGPWYDDAQTCNIFAQWVDCGGV